MPEVQIEIGGRAFSVACQDGEEPYLQAAARMLDTEAAVIQFDHEDCTAKLLLEPSLDQADQEQVAALAA